MLALRAFGRGDVTATHLLWSFDRGPDVPTPASDGTHLYVVTDRGVLWCLDLRTGKPFYGPQRLAVGTYSASPLLADGKLYVTNEDGLTTVIKAGPAFESLAENPLGGFTISSPVAAGSQLFLRTREALYAIGAAPPQALGSVRQLLLRLGQEEAGDEADRVDGEADDRRGPRERLAGVAPGIDVASVVVTNAAEVPIMRPPTFAAKLSPVPRRCVG